MKDLPVTWEWAPLGELAASEARAITDGPFGSNLKTEHYTSVGPQVIRLQNVGFGDFVDGDAHISSEHFERLRKHEARAGDLIVASLGQDLPRSCLVPNRVTPAIIKADCIRIRLHAEMNARYVNYALQRPELKSAVAQRIHGVGRPRLGMDGIKALEIPIAPRAEQDRIVGSLDEQLSCLDATEAVLRSCRLRLDQLLASSRAWIFRQPWPTSPLRSLASTQLGKMLSQKSKTGQGTTPYLRNKNVRWGTIDLSDLATMDFSDDEILRYRLVSGDVLICEGGAGVGRTGIWRSELELCCFQKALHRVRTGPDLMPEFLMQYLRYLVESRAIERHLSGVAIGHFPQEDLRSLSVPSPPVEEQGAIVQSLAQQESLVTSVQQAIDGGLMRSRLLRRAVLAAAFSGRMMLHEATDEPAALLVDRIRSETKVLLSRGGRRKAAS